MKKYVKIGLTILLIIGVLINFTNEYFDKPTILINTTNLIIIDEKNVNRKNHKSIQFTDFQHMKTKSGEIINLNEFNKIDKEVTLGFSNSNYNDRRYKIVPNELNIQDGRIYQIQTIGDFIRVKEDDNNILSLHWDFSKNEQSFNNFILNKLNTNLFVEEIVYKSKEKVSLDQSTNFETIIIEPNSMKYTPHITYFFHLPPERKYLKKYSTSTFYYLHKFDENKESIH